jgi:hypothetical protein
MIKSNTEVLSERYNEPVEPNNEEKPAKVSNQVHSSSKFIRLFVSNSNPQF